MTVTELSKEIPTALFTEGFVDVPLFAACCEKCPGYGKKWACPPYDFDPGEIFFRYSSILLFARKVVLTEEERGEGASGAELKARYDAILRPVKDALLSDLLALEAATPGSLALGAGGCDICGECTRAYGKACVHPEKMRFSVESLGGNVLKALEVFFGEKAEWAENGRLPEKFILLGALLKA